MHSNSSHFRVYIFVSENCSYHNTVAAPNLLCFRKYFKNTILFNLSWYAFVNG